MMRGFKVFLSHSLLPLVVASVFLLFMFAVYINRNVIISLYSNALNTFPQVRQTVEDRIAQEVQKRINTAPGIQAKIESPESFLTVQGVVDFTNKHRSENNLPSLVINTVLNQSALDKARDMFEKQYFAHDSPEGLGVGDLTEEVGYEFIAIGENLATGNYPNDKALVQGWMDSPGHRKNILDIRYREIGVAVVRGVYQGKSTWMAVQHFGFPLSACPEPDSQLEQKIENNKTFLGKLQQELERKRDDIEQTQPKHGPEYNQKVDEYNALVGQYNSLANETKGLIEEFNNQVKAFNECAS